MNDFLSTCTSGGCGAKIGASDLSDHLKNLPKLNNKNLLIGFEEADDAAVYRLNDNEAIIQTVDFFSPMVDDPYIFGKIAAANALSDVYAMGGTPFIALNIVCFPERLPKESLQRMLQGGAEKIVESGATLAGGHSIYDHEPKYGLSVTGRIHPDNLVQNNTPKVGDALILTKPLGVGIILAAHRVAQVSAEEFEFAIEQMIHLNKYAAAKMMGYSVHAATDVTGFGLLGHALEMAGKDYSLVIDTEMLPIIPKALELANEFIVTAGGQRNRLHLGSQVELEDIQSGMQEIMFDPQTSGGLLISVAAEDASKLLKEIQETDKEASIIGTVVEREQKPLILL
ncbi:selenide, water dikinase SelD [Vagococcus elongatus]|uniref:Selenide, water dikinase n=1 Tax=Vagococcus elongatus TaxID=180344 RepID=A0A430AMP8_9ENTE|nr:selenide, water dikinase SelD [Vagococcus elongatus]RSU09346.1 selenide, water dikinase SelD [Vagococcus elongatus]